MRSPTRALLLGLAAVLWLTIVLIGYYYVHKPILPAQALALGRLALTLMGWLATLALAAGAAQATGNGTAICRSLHLDLAQVAG